MRTVTYSITLNEPVLVTALEGDPNSAVSYDYLPGSVLRGAIIGLEKRQHNLSELDLNDKDTRRRFFDGGARFLNGYLTLESGRSLPAPRSWEQTKYAENTDEANLVVDIALNSKGELREHKSKGKAKSLAGKFAVYPLEKAVDKPQVYLGQPEHVINVHTERNRTRGRSVGNGEGTVYRYDALQAGKTFEACILCEDDQDADYFKKLLTECPQGFIGGARSAGYGRVEFGSVSVRETWREVAGELPNPTSSLIITLLSDVILRDEYGQYSPDVPTLQQALATRLGLSQEQQKRLTISYAFKSETLTGGFNRKWGLPLPQAPALSMGSVFVISLASLHEDATNSLKAKLELLEWSGLGERRPEGFGRLAVNWQQHSKLSKLSLSPDKISANTTKDTDSLFKESEKLWQKMTTRIARQKTEREQLKAAYELNLENLPPISQLNRLRQEVTTTILNATNAPSDMTFITNFFKDISGKRAEKHFEQAKVNQKSMKEWLIEQASVEQESKEEELAAKNYAALWFIDGMLARAAKERQKQDSNQRGTSNE